MRRRRRRAVTGGDGRLASCVCCARVFCTRSVPRAFAFILQSAAAVCREVHHAVRAALGECRARRAPVEQPIAAFTSQENKRSGAGCLRPGV